MLGRPARKGRERKRTWWGEAPERSGKVRQGTEVVAAAGVLRRNKLAEPPTPDLRSPKSRTELKIVRHVV